MDGTRTTTSIATSELVRRARRGDRGAFARLIERYERTALAVALAGCGDADLAGDVVQDAMLRAWQRLDELKDDERFAPWLCGVVRHLALDARRRRHQRTTPRSELPASVPAPGDGPIDDARRREECARVLAAIDSLDEASRTAVVLRYYENLTSRQIADLTGSTPAAVDMRLSRARQTLRALLEPVDAKQGKP